MRTQSALLTIVAGLALSAVLVPQDHVLRLPPNWTEAAPLPNPGPRVVLTRITTPHGVLETSENLSPPQIDVIREIIAQSVAAGLDPAHMVVMARIESGFDPAAQNPRSTAAGLYQFLRATAADYGLRDPLDARANIAAAIALQTDIRATLRRRLGQDPAPWMLYLGHQQGATGAARLMLAGERPATSVVSAAAIAGNVLRGTDTTQLTAADFSQLWQVRYMRFAMRYRFVPTA